jgi:hypothetical protein
MVARGTFGVAVGNQLENDALDEREICRTYGATLFLLRIPALTHWANVFRASGAGALRWTIRIAPDALR